MTNATPWGAARLTTATSVGRPDLRLALVIAGAGLGTAGILTARSLGVQEGQTSPTLAVLGGLSAIGTALIARWLDRRGHERDGAGISALSALQVCYLLLSAACGLLLGRGQEPGAIGPLLLGLQAGFFVVPITALLLLALAHGRRHGATGTHHVSRLLVASAALGLAAGLVTLPGSGAFAGVDAPLAALSFPGVEVVFVLGMVTWMLLVLTPGVVLWHSLPRVPAGAQRLRLACAALAAVVPVWTVGMCTALTAIGLVPSEQLAVELLALAYVAPFGVATAALAYGAAAGDKTIGRTATTILTAGFAVGLGGLGGVLAGAVGTAVGATTQGAVLPAVVVSLATTGALLALRAPWQRSLERRLDPDRAAVRSWISGTDAADVLEALRRLDAGAAPRGAPDATAAIASLSPREREVLDLLSRGLSNAAIAAVLVVSERTVDTHVRSIFGKLDLGVDSAVNRRVQAAAHWIRASTGTTDSGASTDARRRDPS